MAFLTAPALAPWLPVILLVAILVVGVVIRASMGPEAGAPPPPPAVHHDGH